MTVQPDHTLCTNPFFLIHNLRNIFHFLQKAAMLTKFMSKLKMVYKITDNGSRLLHIIQEVECLVAGLT